MFQSNDSWQGHDSDQVSSNTYKCSTSGRIDLYQVWKGLAAGTVTLAVGPYLIFVTANPAYLSDGDPAVA